MKPGDVANCDPGLIYVMVLRSLDNMFITMRARCLDDEDAWNIILDARERVNDELELVSDEVREDIYLT